MTAKSSEARVAAHPRDICSIRREVRRPPRWEDVVVIAVLHTLEVPDRALRARAVARP
jgi:hypothetical protein